MAQPTKQQYVEALKEKSVDLKGDEKLADLKALADEHGIDLSTVSNEPVTVKYRDHQGATVERTFSKETHGDNFADVADEFKTTNAARIVNE